MDKIRRRRTSKPVKGVCIWIILGNNEPANQLNRHPSGKIRNNEQQPP
ncbi:hypothetical protein [Ferdinandcohnia sp. SAFN-114]